MARAPLAVCLALLSCACADGGAFDGLAPARETGGPRVVFDLARKPFPEVPFPSDLLARPEPSSPTGRRLNLSVLAPGELDRTLRARLDELDGFSTTAPLSVAFDADVDVLDLFARQNDADPANDAVLVVDLDTGARVPLDFGAGRFPLEIARAGALAADFLVPNDAQAAATNLLFPVGPAPNFLHPPDPGWAAAHGGVPQSSGDLLTFYERATRTLIVHPAQPLWPGHRHAVVLTNRLRGLDGRAIASPHPGINHAAQTAELQPLPGALPPGTALGDVAYAWAFTTQTAPRELELLAAGLSGVGPYRFLRAAYPMNVSGSSFAPGPVSLVTVLQARAAPPWNPATASTSPADYRASAADVLALLQDPRVAPLLLPADPAQAQGIATAFAYLDSFVTIAVPAPDFLTGGAARPEDEAFSLDEATGAARSAAASLVVTVAIPKRRPELGHVQPFPAVVAGHREFSWRLEPLLQFAGTFARLGIATAAVDAFGHGPAFTAAQAAQLRAAADARGLAPFMDALLQGRARDLDGDGVPDPGGDLWTANGFHSRDVLRQSALDLIQVGRALRTFDGVELMALAGGGALAGDFDGDGVPDLGGRSPAPVDLTVGGVRVLTAGAPNPGSDLFAFGVSLGGMIASLAPAVDGRFSAAASIAGGGGLSDALVRSSSPAVARPLFLELLGPFFTVCPFDAAAGPIDWASTTDPANPAHFGACGASGPSTLVEVVRSGLAGRDVPIAPLSLAPGDLVEVRDLAVDTAGQECFAAGVAGCAVAAIDSSGLLRLALPAGVPRPGPAVPGDALILSVRRGGATAATISAFQQPTRFGGVAIAPGAPLTALAPGEGLPRNGPALRRRLALLQTLLDAADPANFARPDESLAARGTPLPLLLAGTPGDPVVPVQAAIAQARAAGLVEPALPDPAFGLPDEQVLLRGAVVEGVAALGRFSSPAAGPPGDPVLGPHVACAGGGCAGAVVLDVSALSCDAGGAGCSDGFAAPRLVPPLREALSRAVDAPVACPVSPLAQGAGCWSTGPSACASTSAGASAGAVSALFFPLVDPGGAHGTQGPQPQKAFDVDSFTANLIARWFECRGRELHLSDRCQAIPIGQPGACAWLPAP